MSAFLKIFSFSFIVILILGMFNFFIDPYGIYNDFLVDGINNPKSEAGGHEKFAKAYLVDSIKPEQIALGTSRVGYGINPQSEQWDGDGRKFNLSIADGSIYVARRFLQHAIAIQTPKQLILGLDFFAFNAKIKTAGDSSEALLAITAEGNVNPAYKKQLLLSSILSYSAVRSSIKTIKKSKEKIVHTLGANTGMRQFSIDGKEYLADEILAIPLSEKLPGASATFASAVRYFIGEKFLIGKDKEYYFEDKDTKNSSMDEFRKIVELCRQNNIQAYFFISPVHARMQEAIRVMGLWSLYEQWKRELVAVLEMEYGGNNYVLWDFSGYNAITRAEVIDGRMREYVDPSHYTPYVGDMILSRLFATRQENIPSDFGKKINGNNIDDVLVLLRQEQKRYQESNIEDVRLVEKIATEQNMQADNVTIIGDEKPVGAKRLIH